VTTGDVEGDLGAGKELGGDVLAVVGVDLRGAGEDSRAAAQALNLGRRTRDGEAAGDLGTDRHQTALGGPRAHERREAGVVPDADAVVAHALAQQARTDEDLLHGVIVRGRVVWRHPGDTGNICGS
jgi:hypothetical protein